MHRSAYENPTFLTLDGRDLEPEAPALCAGMPGVLRGEGVFEAFLVKDGLPTPYLGDHAARLVRSAALIDMDAGVEPMEGLEPFLDRLDRENSWRVRLTLFRRSDDGVSRMWSASPAAPPPAEIALVIAEMRRDPLDPLAGAKTLSRASLQLARRKAQAAGAFEALVPTLDGDLAEGTSSNFFVVRHGVVRTPGLDRGILPGVTRAGVLAVCREIGIPTEETRVEIADLEQAEEIWLTSAILGVQPVVRMVGMSLDLPGAEGPLLPKVQAAWRETWDARLANQ